jgi:hypothetical protein
MRRPTVPELPVIVADREPDYVDRNLESAARRLNLDSYRIENDLTRTQPLTALED